MKLRTALVFTRCSILFLVYKSVFLCMCFSWVSINLFNNYIMIWGPFLERSRNFFGPEANFEIKTCWIVAQFLAHKPANFASLTDSFILSFSKLLRLWSWMQARQAKSSFLGLKSYHGFREMDPWPLESRHLRYLNISNVTVIYVLTAKPFQFYDEIQMFPS